MQNDESEAVVSEPGTINLGGTTYLVAKATDRDVFARVKNARKSVLKTFNPIKEVLDSIKDLSVSEDQKTALLMQAHRIKASGEVPPDLVSDYMQSPKGLAFYAWLLIRKNHPEVTLESIQALITEVNAEDVFAELDEASGDSLVRKALGQNPDFQQP